MRRPQTGPSVSTSLGHADSGSLSRDGTTKGNLISVSRLRHFLQADDFNTNAVPQQPDITIICTKIVTNANRNETLLGKTRWKHHLLLYELPRACYETRVVMVETSFQQQFKKSTGQFFTQPCQLLQKLPKYVTHWYHIASEYKVWQQDTPFSDIWTVTFDVPTTELMGDSSISVSYTMSTGK